MHTPGNSFLGVLRKLLSAVGTPRALTVRILIDHGEWDQVVSLTCDPLLYNDAERYFLDALCTDFIRKMDGLPTTFDLDDRALKSFSESEKTCCRTNIRMRQLTTQGLMAPADEPVRRFLSGIRKDVSRLLGRIPEELFYRHGPGATYGDRGDAISAIHKMSNRPMMTPAMGELLPLWSQTSWYRGLAQSHPDLLSPERVRGNRFTTVPKDATKLRGIAIEPSINIFFQLALGGVIRRRLRRWGLDLDQDQDKHRYLAQRSSRDDSLATIDLSSASDTVSFELVRALVPEDWFALLCSLRSPTTLIDERCVKLEKFSSMGNGFTFELETLVFSAIVRAVCASHGIEDPEWSVFGDDIIVPKETCLSVISVLKFFGFSCNPRKTFTFGYFRESCGGDFFNGKSVRAHFVKSEPSEPHEWIALANGIYRLQEQLAELSSSVSLFRAWESCLNQLPSQIRSLYGPSRLGDLVINTTELRSWTIFVRDSIRYIRGWVPIQRRRSYRGFSQGPYLAALLYGMDSSGFTLRGDVAGYRRKWLPCS